MPGMETNPQSTGLPQPNHGDGAPSTGPSPSVADVANLADSLAPPDRVRLIARLMESLPTAYRAAVVEFGLQSNSSGKLQPRRSRITPFFDRSDAETDAADGPAPPNIVDLIWPKLWSRLFDPAQTSELYSAPRRFDLATIFVVTAAYSLLFGAMSAFNDYFGPAEKVAVGILVTIVAIVQAFYKDTANPRGVSLVTGAVAQSLLVIIARLTWPSLIRMPFLVALIIFGVLGGLVTGYLAGALVGGVFLVADMVRTKWEKRSAAEASHTSVDDVE